jgi:hypothetical protein
LLAQAGTFTPSTSPNPIMCNLYSITTNQAAMAGLFRRAA